MVEKLDKKGKIVVYDEKGDVESEYVIDFDQNKGGVQIFLVATNDSGPGGITRCIAHCSKSFLVHALSYHAARFEWLRATLNAVAHGPGFLGFLKSSQGSFMLGLYSMLGLNWFIDGLTNGSHNLAVIGAVVAGMGFCAHNFLPSQKILREEIEEK